MNHFCIKESPAASRCSPGAAYRTPFPSPNHLPPLLPESSASPTMNAIAPITPSIHQFPFGTCRTVHSAPTAWRSADPGEWSRPLPPTASGIKMILHSQLQAFLFFCIGCVQSQNRLLQLLVLGFQTDQCSFILLRRIRCIQRFIQLATDELHNPRIACFHLLILPAPSPVVA